MNTLRHQVITQSLDLDFLQIIKYDTYFYGNQIANIQISPSNFIYKIVFIRDLLVVSSNTDLGFIWYV